MENEQLAKFLSDKLDQTYLRLKERIDSVCEDVKDLRVDVAATNGNLRVHDREIVTLKTKIAHSEKRWDFWVAVIGSPIIGAIVGAVTAIIFK